MRVIELDPEGTKMRRAIASVREAHDRARPRGLHLSRITDDMVKIIYPKLNRKRDLPPERAEMAQEWGNQLEDIFAHGFRTTFAKGWRKPEPRKVHGIWCSPDGESVRQATIDEIKATWVSERNFLQSDKFKAYCLRIMGYLFAWGWVRARLTVFFVCGDWRPPLPTYPRTYILNFEKTEIKTMWKIIRQHAVDRGWLHA